MNTWLVAAGLQKVELKTHGRVVESLGTKVHKKELERKKAWKEVVKKKRAEARLNARIERYNAKKKTPCKCGCGALTIRGWASGHNGRGEGGFLIDAYTRRQASLKTYHEKKKAEKLKPCKCGCGELTAFEWKAGHSGRGENGFATYQEASKERKRARDRIRAQQRKEQRRNERQKNEYRSGF